MAFGFLTSPPPHSSYVQQSPPFCEGQCVGTVGLDSKPGNAWFPLHLLVLSGLVVAHQRYLQRSFVPV